MQWQTAGNASLDRRLACLKVFRHTPLARASSAASRASAVDPNARKGTLRERTTLAHELGHMNMHGLADHFAQCDPSEERRSGTDWRLEGEAYDFGRALMAPAWLAAARRPSLDDVERFARVSACRSK